MKALYVIMGLVFITGCAGPTVYREVRVPVPVPCKAQDPHTYGLAVEEFNELAVRDRISRGEYGELVYQLGSSLIILNGDVKAYREVLGSCQ